MHLLATLSLALVAAKGTIYAATIPLTQSLTPGLTNKYAVAANLDQHSCAGAQTYLRSLALPQTPPNPMLFSDHGGMVRWGRIPRHNRTAVFEDSPCINSRLSEMPPLPNPYRISWTISLYFRPTDVSLNPRDALQVTIQALEKMVLVDLQAARDRIPNPRVPAAGVSVRRGSTVIGIIPNPAAPDKLQTAIARQALEGMILYCVEEGWGGRAVEIHHDVQGYVANVVYTQHIGDR